MKDLIIDEKIITLKNVNLICTSSLEMFNLKSVIKCLPTDWKNKQFHSRNSKLFKEGQERKMLIYHWNTEIMRAALEKVSIPTLTVLI